MAEQDSTITPHSNGDYHVDLPHFQGPLDLLLGLIQDKSLDITTISLAHVTHQYLAYLEIIKEFNPTELTDFLVIAARLILIKSQVLLPKPPPMLVKEDEEDVGEALTRQLLVYKQFKEMAGRLRKIEQQECRNFIRTAPPPKIKPQVTALQVSINDLLEAARQAFAIKPSEPNVDEVVSRQIVTIGQQMTEIRYRLGEEHALKFEALLQEQFSRVEVIVTLLATLELIKRQLIEVKQTALFGEIMIYLSPNPPRLTEADWAELAGQIDLS